MKIFVAHGFNDRDQWVTELVFPIIRAFNDEVVTGEDLQGEKISEAVEEKLRQSDALIAFVTRREQIENGLWTTHRWVTDEMASFPPGRFLVEVREAGVEDQRGMYGDRQKIFYEEGKRDICLVELVKTIGKWHRGESVKLQLLPEEYTREIYPLLRDPGLRCLYRLLVDGEVGKDIQTRILPIKGGLFVETKNVPRLAMIQVQIEYRGKMWLSDFESTDSIGVNLRKD